MEGFLSEVGKKITDRWLTQVILPGLLLATAVSALFADWLAAGVRRLWAGRSPRLRRAIGRLRDADGVPARATWIGARLHSVEESAPRLHRSASVDLGKRFLVGCVRTPTPKQQGTWTLETRTLRNHSSGGPTSAGLAERAAD